MLGYAVWNPMTRQLPTARLLDVADVQFGFPFASALFNERGEGMPLIRIRDLAQGWCSAYTTEEYAQEYLVVPGDLVVGMDGEFRPYIWRAAPALLNQRVCKIIPKDGPEMTPYLRAALVPALAAVEHGKSGTTVVHLNKTDLERVTLPWPPREERLAMGALLGSLEEKIELNRRMNQTLEAIARAIFKSWFVDFDPVRAKIDGVRLPGVGLETGPLYPGSFEDSPIGRIPEGWSVGSLGEVAVNIRRDVDPDDTSSDTPYIGLDHMPRRSIALAEWGTLGGLVSGKWRFEAGEILFGKLRPYFHKVGVAPITGACSTEILVIAPKSPTWRSFVLMHLSSDELIAYADAHSSGTRMPRVSWRDIAHYPIPIPPESIAESFEHHVWPLIQRVVSNIRESRALAVLRDSLLPKLISGEIRASQGEVT